MKFRTKVFLTALLSSAVFLACSVCGAADIESLADQFQKATDIQRAEIEELYRDTGMLSRATVANVELYNFFDEQNDIQTRYYRVTTITQKTRQNTPYQVVLLYSDVDKIKHLKRGENIEVYGRLWRITDDGLWVSIWLYGEESSPEIKQTF